MFILFLLFLKKELPDFTKRPFDFTHLIKQLSLKFLYFPLFSPLTHFSLFVQWECYRGAFRDSHRFSRDSSYLLCMCISHYHQQHLNHKPGYKKCAIFKWYQVNKQTEKLYLKIQLPANVSISFPLVCKRRIIAIKINSCDRSQRKIEITLKLDTL